LAFPQYFLYQILLLLELIELREIIELQQYDLAPQVHHNMGKTCFSLGLCGASDIVPWKTPIHHGNNYLKNVCELKRIKRPIEEKGIQHSNKWF